MKTVESILKGKSMETQILPDDGNAFTEGLSIARAYFAKLALDGQAAIQVNDARADVFFDITIEGVRFQAQAGTDPIVVRKDNGEWCQFGVASIQPSNKVGSQHVDKKWMVCKYSATEGRIDLSSLTDAGRRSFAIAFGIPIGHPDQSFHGSYGFYASQAFDGLVAWGARRPRKLKSESGISHYVGDWQRRVMKCLAEIDQ